MLAEFLASSSSLLPHSEPWRQPSSSLLLHSQRRRQSSSSLFFRKTMQWRTTVLSPGLLRAQQVDPQQPPSGDDTSELRPDINPTVLRALQGEQLAASLIERNLRKRAAARQSPGDGGRDLAVSSPLPDDVGGFAANQAIKHVFWEKTPEDLTLPTFMSLEFHARLYRIFVLILLVMETDMSLAAVLWFSLPSEVLPFEPADLPPSLLLEWAKWRRSIAADLWRVTEDNRIYLAAARRFEEFWHDYKISDDKKICLLNALALILNVEMLEAVRSAGGSEGGKVSGVEKRLRESSEALGVAIGQLQKETLDPEGMWEEALKGTCMASDGRVFVFQEALLFPVIRDSSANGGKNDAGELLRAMSQVEQRLEANYPSRVVRFLRSETHRDLFYVVVAPWYWFLSTNFDNVSAVNCLLLVASFLATAYFPAADPGLNSAWIAWEPCVVPVGWSAVLAAGIMAARFMATKHSVPSSFRNPIVFAFPHLGAVGRLTPFAGILPSRGILLDILLSGSYASLLASALLLTCGFVFWGPSHFISASTADFRGYLLVPADLFSYSGVFTRILSSVSVALLKGDDGTLALATSPFALAGLLGLHFTAFSLFPTSKSDGTLLLRALLGNTRLTGDVSLALAVLVSVVFFFKNPTVGIWWAVYSFLFSSENCSMKDEVSEPSFFKTVAGFVLVAAAVLCFVPVSQ